MNGFASSRKTTLPLVTFNFPHSLIVKGKDDPPSLTCSRLAAVDYQRATVLNYVITK